MSAGGQSSSQVEGVFSYEVQKRATPTLSTSGNNFELVTHGGTTSTGQGLLFDGQSTKQSLLYNNGLSGHTQGNFGRIKIESGGSLYIDAEL